jgi:hypothetical protein
MADKNTDAGAPPTADELRMRMLQKELDEMERRQKALEAEQKERSAMLESFLHDEVTDKERALIRRLVENAAASGKFEAMVYSFPSSLCMDSGRAINNNIENWPETLQGKAKKLYDRYQQVAKPAGYRLKAMIINFPGGIPGDVGLFLTWEPPAS